MMNKEEVKAHKQFLRNREYIQQNIESMSNDELIRMLKEQDRLYMKSFDRIDRENRTFRESQ